jgi:hypothetical protein
MKGTVNPAVCVIWSRTKHYSHLYNNLYADFAGGCFEHFHFCNCFGQHPKLNKKNTQAYGVRSPPNDWQTFLPVRHHARKHKRFFHLSDSFSATLKVPT